MSVHDFAWQQGYACFTVSPYDQKAIKSYIRNQAKHHYATSYLEELKWMLSRAGIEYDDKYLE